MVGYNDTELQIKEMICTNTYLQRRSVPDFNSLQTRSYTATTTTSTCIPIQNIVSEVWGCVIWLQAIFLMPIRMPISFSIPMQIKIRIRILPHVSHILENQIF